MKNLNLNFNEERYYYLNYNPYELGFMRKRTRGFASITASILHEYYNNRGGGNAIIEIGIGGGGPQIGLRECLNNDVPVYGVDIFDPEVILDNEKMYIKGLNSFKNATTMAAEVQNDNFSLFWGSNGYSKETVEKIVAYNHNNKMGVVIDDGDTNLGALNGLGFWKDQLDDSGYIITEGPFGNGIEPVWNIYQDPVQRTAALKKCSELNQMVIFDCHHLKFDPNRSVDYVVPYLGIYTKDWASLRNSKFHELFSPYIVEGRQYYDA